MLFKSTECLWLGKLKGITNVIPALDGDGFPILKHLRIYTDDEIQYVVNVEDKQCETAFPCLESLQLSTILKLQKICNGPLMKESFCNLTSVRVDYCYKLESLFSFSMATTRLPRLQQITVLNCNALEAIVAEKNIHDDGVNINDGVCEEIEFAQLRKLTLFLLPKLKTFFSNGEKSLSPEIDTRDEEDQKLKSSLPFFTKVSFPKLEELNLYEISSFKYLLTSSIATSLVGLKSLDVRDCVGVKHLVVAEEGETNIETITFPQLSDLCLRRLPDLTTIYSGMGLNENLDTPTQPLFSEKVSFLKLQILELHEISNLTLIWSHKFQEISCNNLTRLTIAGCKSLKHVFPTYVASYLNILEYLNVEDCEEVKTIIGDENREKEEIIKATKHEHVATFIFAKLTKVCLRNLPKVECFYSREHRIECPALMSIYVNCGKLNAFDFLSIPEKQGDNLFEKVMSKLEDLTIRNSDLTKILQLYDHFPTHLFSSLERLSIVEFHGGSVIFPLVSFKSLEWLSISGCEMIEKVIGDNDEVLSPNDNEIIFPNLCRLKLEKLPRLTNFCSSTNYTFNFPKLKFVVVRECPNMKTFCGGSSMYCCLCHRFLMCFAMVLFVA